MQYDVVFDAMQQPPEWQGPAIGMVFVAMGFAMWKSERLAHRNVKNAKTSLFTRVFLGFPSQRVSGATFFSSRGSGLHSAAR